jgi:TolB-like protein/Tfp pilus assembly protein PilF/predicted Ser/Thr protein kinase
MVGQTVSHYRILGKLGAGGMGVVYKAEDLKLRRTVALKFLPPEMVRNPEAKARFVHEAQAAAALNHPNIATIHEIHEADGHTFIVMEYVEGQSLKDRLASGPLPVPEALTIASQVTAGLEKAHSRGIVHRDIKPANILFTADGMAKIADFGLAKLDEQTRLTKTGTMVGTVVYMSPEQVQGGTVDQRTDLWSLGVMLYEMITGRLPFRGEAEPAVMYSILNGVPEPVTSLSQEASVQLENLLDKALAKDPERRYQSADELLTDLAEQRELLESGLVTRRFLALRRFRRNRRAFYGTLAGLAVVLVATVALVFHGQSMAIDSIAVLPFESLTEAADQEYIADGMTRELTATLGQVSGWSKVISNRTMRKYQGTDKSLRDIASEVSVKAVLAGSVQRLANEYIQTIVELVDGGTGKLLWTHTYECALHDFKNLQSDITRAITALVDIELTTTEEGRLARAAPVNPVAYEYYMKGLHHYEKWTTEGFYKAIEYFKKAIEADPNHARAYDGLADCYLYLGFIGTLSRDEALTQGDPYLRKALEIDDLLPQAHETMAGIKHYYDWDWKGAETGYRRVIQLDPSFVEAHVELACLLDQLGRSAEAMAEARIAQQLDPLSIPAVQVVGHVYYNARQYDQAITQYRQLAELEPENPAASYFLARVYERMNRYEDAVRARKECMRLYGFSPAKVAAFDSAYSESGPRGYWMWLLKNMSGRYERNPLKAAKIHAQLGDRDQAFIWLEKAYDNRDPKLVGLKIEPYWDPLRGDPRYHDLLRRMNLEER